MNGKAIHYKEDVLKPIYNWKLATVADLESDNLLDLATKLHVLGFQMNEKDIKTFRGSTEGERIVKFFQWHVDNEIPIVMHNGISFDVPLMEKLFGIDLSKLMLIDTLALSWYLNPDRRQHGLGTFWEDYGIEKPVVEDWSEQPYEVYQNRVVEDVKINQALWKDLKKRLIELYTTARVEIDSGAVGGKRLSDDEVLYIDSLVGFSVEEHINRLLTFLMFKMDCARLQEKTRWEVDVDLLLETEKKLEVICEAARSELESVMPKVPQFTKKEAPKKPYKKDGTLSAIGVKWEELMRVYDAKEVDEYGTLKVQQADVKGVYKVLNGYEEPSASSPAQVKALLYSHGWVPVSFKYEKDEEKFNAWIAKKPKEGSHHSKWTEWKESRPEERAIPQITVGGEDGKELCESVLELAEDVPEIRKYAEYNVAKHRLGVVKGFIRDLKDGKWLQARIGGFTNTLRVQHRELVNLPGVDKAYGEDIRGVLISGEGKCLLGSDMSSLEDRVKHNFMLPHDPEYVATMQEEDYDPHILMALTAGMVTKKEFEDFKRGEKSANAKAARKKGKTTNYASVYNAGAAKIAQAAGIPLKEGKQLHEAYWELNWSVKAIAEEQVVIRDSKGGKWLVNPINGFCYSLRKESDRFSTLAQGTGSYFFDMWVDNILNETQARYGKKTLTGSFHDECILCVKDSEKFKSEFAEIIKEAVDKVNTDYKLRRKLGCDVQTGKRYSEIH
jgi:DNA polymerase I-like protein with 3'-5' exonuclease and polymerase domains